VSATPRAAAQPEPLLLLFPSGRCRVCGWSDSDKGEITKATAAWWVDSYHTLCTKPQCVRIAGRKVLAESKGAF
jgi:hypothetical protein